MPAVDQLQDPFIDLPESALFEIYRSKISLHRNEGYSAGNEPAEVHPCAVSVMAEAGIDISAYRAKSWDVFDEASFDFVVTMCADAQENCPVFPGGTTYLHHGFADPVAVTRDKDQCVPFRHARDQIRRWIDTTFSTIGANFDAVVLQVSSYP